MNLEQQVAHPIHVEGTQLVCNVLHCQVLILEHSFSQQGICLHYLRTHAKEGCTCYLDYLWHQMSILILLIPSPVFPSVSSTAAPISGPVRLNIFGGVCKR